MEITDRRLIHCKDGNGREYYFAYVVIRGKNWFFNLFKSHELHVVHSSGYLVDANGPHGRLIHGTFAEDILVQCNKYGTKYMTLIDAKYALKTAIDTFITENKSEEISVVKTVIV